MKRRVTFGAVPGKVKGGYSDIDVYVDGCFVGYLYRKTRRGGWRAGTDGCPSTGAFKRYAAQTQEAGPRRTLAQRKQELTELFTHTQR